MTAARPLTPRVRATAAAALSILVGGVAADSQRAAAAPPAVDYLYVEANEGGSSGGHVALRIGADVFHFQQAERGLIRMRRDDADAFTVRYALLGNRPIHETGLAVSEDTAALLRDILTHRLLVQAAQFEHLDALRRDVALFDRWPHDGTAAAPFPVRAAGYFLDDPFSSGAALGEPSPALLALRTRIGREAGEDFLAARAARVRSALASWQPRAVRNTAPSLDRTQYPTFEPTASTIYAEQLETLTALEILAAARAPRADACRDANVLAPLDERERAYLIEFERQLAGDLSALAQSPRADIGYPLLLGMARLAAIERSLASGEPVVVDAFATDAPVATLPDEPERSAMLAALSAELRPAAEHARRELFATADFREADYTQFETAVNRLLEVERAHATGAPLRLETGLLLPARAAARVERAAPPLTDATARAEARAAREAVAEYRTRLAGLYEYNLLTRNCVSEVFAAIDAALAADVRPGETVADASRRRLGGVVSMGANLNFIPVVSADAVARHYATEARRTRPSYRQLRLAALRGERPAWLVALRESNTLTATAYHPGADDSSFLFFTDESAPLRPLLGAVNLLVGIGNGALGLFTWPRDDGGRLRAGARGALFSLPELAFVNIRKGSTSWIEPELLAGLAPQ